MNECLGILHSIEKLKIKTLELKNNLKKIPTEWSKQQIGEDWTSENVKTDQ